MNTRERGFNLAARCTACRDCRSDAAVTVQVFTIAHSASIQLGTWQHPASSKMEAILVESAWLDRQPNVTNEKVKGARFILFILNYFYWLQIVINLLSQGESFENN